jgi:hypothetical protein
VLVDLTCDTADSSHADQVVKQLEELDGVDVRKVSDRTFLLHLGGKIEVRRRSRCATATSCPGVHPGRGPGLHGHRGEPGTPAG